MRVWLINHYAGNTFFDKGGRHYYIAKYLKKQGYDVTVFCSNSKHICKGVFFDENKLFLRKKQKDINVPFVFVKSRTYDKNNVIRILNMYDFYQNMKKTADIFVKHGEFPDIIIASSVHPLTLLAGQEIARKYGIKCICEVRDLWPETFLSYDIVKSRKNPMMGIMYTFEKYLYKKADRLVFTMEGGYDYIQDKDWTKVIPQSKVFCINNGVDLEDFNNNMKSYQINDVDLKDKDSFKVVYTGSIRRVNNIGKILDIARKLREKKIKFLIFGAGDQVEMLQKRVIDEDIGNVYFKGFIEKKYIPYVTSMADLNIMDMQEKNQIFQYGISPNKLFEYFAAKKPILMYQLDSYNPALEYGVGFVANSMEEIEKIIKGIADCDNAYTISNHKFDEACKAYSYENLTNKLIQIIEGCN